MDWDMIMKKFPVLHDYLLGDILTCFLCKKIANLPCSGNICHRLRRFQDICLHFLQYPPLPTHKPTSNNFSVLWIYLDIICLPQVNHFPFLLMFFPSISFLCRSSKSFSPTWSSSSGQTVKTTEAKISDTVYILYSLGNAHLPIPSSPFPPSWQCSYTIIISFTIISIIPKPSPSEISE